MTTLGRPPVLADIVEEHFDELDFLWEHRESNIFTPDWVLSDLAEHEERAEAHLDGLRLAELHAVDLARERLMGEETFAATAATLVLLETGVPELLDLVREALRSAGQEAFHGVRIALRHHRLEPFEAVLRDLSAGSDPLRAAGAADVLAFQRLACPGLERLVRTEEPVARVLALSAAGRLGALTTDDVRAATASPQADVRKAAFEAAARMGMPELAAYGRAAATREVDPDPEAVALLGVLGNAADVATLHTLVARPELAEAAVGALGALGRVEAVPLLLELTADDALGIPATAAYRRVTGADDVEGEKPFPPPEVAEGEDEEEALPPDPAKARADWERRASLLPPSSRWQRGFPVSDGYLPPEFDALTLECRRDVYLALRAQVGAGAPDLELEALAWRQRPTA